MRVSRVLVVVLATLLPLLALPTASTGASTATASASSIAVSAPTPERRAVQGDFPRLPPQCYDENDVITSPCQVTSYRGRPTVILWGDSHAQMYLAPIRQLARRYRVNLIAVLFGGCPVSEPFTNTTRYPRTGCDQHNLDSLAYVRQVTQRRKHVRIVLNGFWSGYRHAYELIQEEKRTGVPSGLSDYRKRMAMLGEQRTRPMFRQIGRLGVPVDLVAQAMTVPLEPRTCQAGREPYQCNLPRSRAMYKEGDNRRWLRQQLGSVIPGTQRVIDPSPTYCNRRTCFAHVKGSDAFYDDIHLSASVTRSMTGYFRPVFQDLLAR